MQNKAYSLNEVLEILPIKMGKYIMTKGVLMYNLRMLGLLEHKNGSNYPPQEYVAAGWFVPKVVVVNQLGFYKPCLSEKGIMWLKTNWLFRIKKCEYEYWKLKYPKHLNDLAGWGIE